MNRVLLAVFALAALPLVSRAGDDVVHLKVWPMPAPKPALQYQLLPEVKELTPGNPAQWYMRCFAEQRNFFFTKFSADQRARYLSMPLSQLRAEKIRRYGGAALTQADWAARLDALDWQVTERVQTDGLDMRVPELEPLKVLATALKVRFRIEVAGSHFDDAVRTAKTLFALARHLGEYPAREANQVGLFVAHLALDEMEEMIQQPDCPNLYWALTELSTPLVELRKGFQGDRSLVETELRPIRADAAMTADELEKVVSRLSGVMGLARVQAGEPSRSLRVGLAARLKDTEKVSALRDRLVKSRGRVLADRSRDQVNKPNAFLNSLFELTSATDQIRKMPPLQLILLDAKREFEAQSDERLKLLALPPWQIDRLGGAERERGDGGLFADLLPSVIPARRAQGRLEQRIALLRHVEALRLHAADHDGKLPEKLSDVAVPLPNDPFTGKPFDYESEAATVHLSSRSPRQDEPSAACKVRYKVTFSK